MSNYNLTTDVQGDSGALPFTGGINEPVEMTNVSYRNTKADGTGQDCLTFEFQNSNGGVFRYIAWPVNEDRVRENAINYKKQHARDDKQRGFVKGQDITPEQAIIKAYDEFFSRIKHIMTKFIPEADTTIKASSYEDLSRQIVSKLSGKYAGIKLRIKVVYRGKYLNFPKFGNCVEVIVPDVPTKLTITQWDTVIPKVVPDSDPEDMASMQAAETQSDLPF